VTFKVQNLQSGGASEYDLVSLPVENADQTVKLEWDHQKAWKEFLESVDSSDQTPSEAGSTVRISFQYAVALGIDDSMAFVADRDVVEKREEVEYRLERVGGQRA